MISNSVEFDERFFPDNSTKAIDWPLPPLKLQEPVDQVGDNYQSVDPLPPFTHFEPKCEQSEPGLAQNEPEQPEQQEERPNTPQTPPASPEQPAPQPVQTPVQQPSSNLGKRTVLSPGEGMVSPEHKASKPNPRPQPRPKAPEFKAQPMSDFKPKPAETGYGRFEHFRSFRDFMPRSTPGQNQSSQASSSSGLVPPFEFRPQQHPQPPSEQPIRTQEEEDVDMDRSSSPDPLDFLGQQQQQPESEEEELMAIALSALSAQQSDFFTLSEAVEFAFNANSEMRTAAEPNQWKDIAGRPDASKWHDAAFEEFNALLENGTFEPVQLPAGRKAIGCRWVFKLKRLADGSIDRYKARLVAKGFSQRPGLDFSQVFAPTARWAALRAIFALSAIEDLELYSLDISNAFLNGELDHDVYMQQPEGFRDRFAPGCVLKLNNALYGLKQAGHQWHKKLNSVLTSLDFKLVRCDNSIWVYQKDSTRIIVPVHVDDMTIACKRRSEYTQFVAELRKHFKLKELGPSSSLLAVAIGRDRSKRLLTLSQQQFIEDVLERFGMSDCHPVTTPLV